MEPLICSCQEGPDVTCKVYQSPNKKMRVELCWDQAPCAGHQIKIDDVKINGQEIKIYYRKIVPDEEAIYCQVLKKPKATYEVSLEQDQESYVVTLVNS